MIAQESFEDRTEVPTPRRIQEARKKGQVVYSRDLAAALTLVATAGAFALLGPWLVASLRAGLSRSLSTLHEMESGNAASAVVSSGGTWVGAAAPLMLFALAAGAAATIVQIGFLFTGETLKLRVERLDPMEGIRRAFSMRTFVGIAGGLARGAVILGVLAASLWQEKATLAGLSSRPMPEALAAFTGSAITLFAKTALALAALGVIDWAYRRWQHLRDLRMSRREVQDELREFEGDPSMRNRRRTHHAQLEESRFIGQVPSAAVIVTDAGDLAIALRLTPEGTPVVIVTGQGATADRIRATALGHAIPILERPDLARSLARRGKAGTPVPSGLREDSVDAIAVGKEMKGLGRHDA